MFICLDLETTGLNPKEDKIIEVAIVRFDHTGVIDEWSSFVDPGMPIPEFTKRLTGIDDSMVKGAPRIHELEEIIYEKVGDLPIMGHFIFFDLNFLNHHGFDMKNTQLDTCQYAQAILTNEASYSLEVLVDKLELTQPSAHRALDDVKANIQLFWRMNKHLRALEEKDKLRLKPLLEKTSWTWAPIFSEVIEQDTKVFEAESIQANVRKIKEESKSHLDLIEATQGLTAPFLYEESTHTLLDLIKFSTNAAQDKDLSVENPKCLLLVPDLEVLPNTPELGTLKSASEYLDEDRFKLWSSKEKLTESEGKLAIKIALWLSQTTHGEKKEMRLVKDEKHLWDDICGIDNLEPNSFYKKAFDEAMSKEVITMEHVTFLKEKSRKDSKLTLPKKLVVAQTSQVLKAMEYAWHIKLSESKFLNDILTLKHENPEATEVLDHIAGRITILFGFMGMMLQHHGETKDPRHTLVMEAHHRNTLEWNKVSQSAQSIESSLAALSEDIDPSPRRDEFERYLRYLNTIIQNANSVLWMTLSRDRQVIVHSFPDNTKDLFAKRIWHGHELYLFSNHEKVDAADTFVRTELGLPTDITIADSHDNGDLPIIPTQTKIKVPNDPGNIADCIHELNIQLKDLEGDLYVLTTSTSVAEQFFYKFKQVVAKHDRKLFVQHMSGGMGKIYKMSRKTEGKNIFVGQESLLRNLLREDAQIQTLAIQRFPFSRPNDPVQKTRSKHYEDVYKEFSLPQAKLRLNQIQHSFLGNNWGNKQIIILDPRDWLMR